MSELSVRYSALLVCLLCLGASHAYARVSLRGSEPATKFSELEFDDFRLGDLKQNVPGKKSTGLTSQQGLRDRLSGVAFKDSHFGNKKQVVPGQENTNFDAQRGFDGAALEDFRLGDQKQVVPLEEVTTLGSQLVSKERGGVLDGVPCTAHVLEAQGGRMQHVPVRTVTRSSSQWGPQRGLVSTEAESTLGVDQPAVVLHSQSEPFLIKRNGDVGARNDSRFQGEKHAPVVESRGSEEAGVVGNAEVRAAYSRVKGDRLRVMEDAAEPLEGYDSASVSTLMRREGAGISSQEKAAAGLGLVRRGRGQAMEESEEQLWRGGKAVTKQLMRIVGGSQDETGLVVGNPEEAEAGSFKTDEVRTLRMQ
jgi:hypothetical protein